MCPCPINILDFWYNRRNIKDGLDNFVFAKLHDLMTMFAVYHILQHYCKKYFYLLIMLKQKQTYVDFNAADTQFKKGTITK